LTVINLTPPLRIGDRVTWTEPDNRGWWRRTMPRWLGGRKHVPLREAIITEVSETSDQVPK
jgi:hypothetical protein